MVDLAALLWALVGVGLVAFWITLIGLHVAFGLGVHGGIRVARWASIPLKLPWLRRGLLVRKAGAGVERPSRLDAGPRATTRCYAGRQVVGTARQLRSWC